MDAKNPREALSSVSAGSTSKLRRLRIYIRRGSRGEHGGSLVEFAMVLPLLMLVTTGIFAFGIALNNYLELTNAVTLGAQQLAISRGNTLDPCATVSNAVEQAAPNLTTSKLTFTTVIATSSSSSASFSGASCSSGSTTTGAAGDLTAGEPIQVTATYPCTLAGYGFNLGCNLSAQITEISQ
jgi:Flp pilus assembly protein TadG